MGHDELKPEDVDFSITALRAALKRTWYAFCDTTSIHGLKYTKDEDINRFIRFIWILITLTMFVCAIVMVVTFYMEYRSNPTRMNVENNHAPVSNLIFPPTTVCPEVIYNVQKSQKFLQTLILPNSTSIFDIQELLYYMYGLMYDGVIIEEKNIKVLEELLSLNKLNIFEFANQISWDCNDLLFRCRFKDKIVPCNELFQASLTFRGHCCSFNLNQTFTSFNNRYAHAGLRNGLSIILNYNDSVNALRGAYSHGFKILVQEVNAFPSAHSVVKFVPLDEESFITIKPMQTFCSQAVKDLSFENRLCVFPQEKKLKFFHSYIGANCEVNCRVQMMLRVCNCYTYFFYNNRTDDRICSFKDMPCLIKNYATIIGRFKKTQCTCYRNCEKIEYDLQVTTAPLNLNTPTVDPFYDDLKKDYSVVHIYMNSQVYRKVRHDLLSNMVTLVSNLGSAFSLFVGMSMISAVEIIYYFSIILNKFYQQECKARYEILTQKYKLKTNGYYKKRDKENNLKVEEIY